MSLVPKTYDLLVRAVEDGVAYGVDRRCREKRDLIRCDDAASVAIQQEIAEAVLNSICEWFDIREPGEAEDTDARD